MLTIRAIEDIQPDEQLYISYLAEVMIETQDKSASSTQTLMLTLIYTNVFTARLASPKTIAASKTHEAIWLSV